MEAAHDVTQQMNKASAKYVQLSKHIFCACCVVKVSVAYINAVALFKMANPEYCSVFVQLPGKFLFPQH